MIKHKSLKVPLFILGIFLATFVHSQELISGGGSLFTTGQGTLTWSIGEPVIETYIYSGDALTQGFHQTCFLFLNVSDFSPEGFDARVYPNPATEMVYLQIESLEWNGFSYTLTNSLGDFLQQGNIVEPLTEINMTPYPSANYFLSVFQDNTLLKCIQIIKNQ